MEIRALEAEEIDIHRELRLRALRDAPDSFADAYDEVAAKPRSYWEEHTRGCTETNFAVMFLAAHEDRVLGSTYGFKDRERDDTARVGGMWVDPTVRGKGVGRALLEAVFAWARSCGLKRIALWAPAHNPAALALYTHASFSETGRDRAMPTKAQLRIIEMERTL